MTPRLNPDLKKVCLIIPTTSGINVVQKARFSKAPLSQVYTAGDYLEAPQSQRAQSLMNGPLAKFKQERGSLIVSLSKKIDDGRSWELGFAVAAMLTDSQDFSLVSSLEEAEQVLLVTGSVDEDCNPIAGHYHLDKKLVYILDAVGKAPTKLLICPELKDLPQAANQQLSASLPYREISDYDGLTEALNLQAETVLDQAEPVETAIQDKRSVWLLLGLIFGCGLLLALAAFRFLPLASAPIEASIEIWGQYSNEIHACSTGQSHISRIEGSSFYLQVEGLCALKIRNISDQTYVVEFGQQISSIDMSSAGSTSMTLVPEQEFTNFLLIFPSSFQETIRVSHQDKTQDYHLKLE